VRLDVVEQIGLQTQSDFQDGTVDITVAQFERVFAEVVEL